MNRERENIYNRSVRRQHGSFPGQPISLLEYLGRRNWDGMCIIGNHIHKHIHPRVEEARKGKLSSRKREKDGEEPIGTFLNNIIIFIGLLLRAMLRVFVCMYGVGRLKNSTRAHGQRFCVCFFMCPTPPMVTSTHGFLEANRSISSVRTSLTFSVRSRPDQRTQMGTVSTLWSYVCAARTSKTRHTHTRGSLSRWNPSEAKVAVGLFFAQRPENCTRHPFNVVSSHLVLSTANGEST